MSLYYEGAEILESIRRDGGSIKSTVFAKKTWKSDPKALFALTTEASKWSEILTEVIESSGILKIEKQLSPTLALLLVHDLLISRTGLALPAKHGLATAISRHKARLTAELTKARLRHGFASLEALRAHVNEPSSSNGNAINTDSGPRHPRWIRINTLCTSLSEQLDSTFAEYSRPNHLQDVTTGSGRAKLLYVDQNVPDLIAIPPTVEITMQSAYKEGKLILQDKASCFPALLLDPGSVDGDIIDACAAPGNKTTHLAALIANSRNVDNGSQSERKIYACERDAVRSQTLEKMIKLAGADHIVQIKAKQDFMKLNPQSKEFANVTCLLLDPSCSGSGIVGRDEVSLQVHLPDASKQSEKIPKGKKRKRNEKFDKTHSTEDLITNTNTEVEEVLTQLDADDAKLQARLLALSTFQLRLLQHAMSFPAAKRITYSTCSIHRQENERVVVKALVSDVARERGWRILRRHEQVDGLRSWMKRGDLVAVAEMLSEPIDKETELDPETIADASVRCEKNSEEGTMGFFVAGFIRDQDGTNTNGPVSVDAASSTSESEGLVGTGAEEGVDEWNGFSDDET